MEGNSVGRREGFCFEQLVACSVAEGIPGLSSKEVVVEAEQTRCDGCWRIHQGTSDGVLI